MEVRFVYSNCPKLLCPGLAVAGASCDRAFEGRPEQHIDRLRSATFGTENVVKRAYTLRAGLVSDLLASCIVSQYASSQMTIGFAGTDPPLS